MFELIETVGNNSSKNNGIFTIKLMQIIIIINANNNY